MTAGLSGVVAAYAPGYMSLDGTRRYLARVESADRFVELVNRAAADDHLDLLAALIGSAFEPTANVGGVLLELDALAGRCSPDFESVMGTLFGSGRLRGNRDDYGDPRNSYLHRVLDRGLGIPITLSVCAIEVGRRLGVDIRGVGLPSHFVVVCGEQYGDPFHGGSLHDRLGIEARWRALTGAEGAVDDRLFEPVRSRTILLRMLNNLKQTFVAMDDPATLRVLAQLRHAFPELAGEETEHARWMRHWN